MRKTLIVVAVVLWGVGLGFFVYLCLPRERQVVVTQVVPRTMTKMYTTTIDIEGTKRQITVPTPYLEYSRVHETKTMEPSREQWLRFTLLVGAGGLLYLYFLIVIVVYGYTSFVGEELPRGAENQLAGTIAFLTGVIGGFVAAPSTIQPTQQQVVAPGIDNDGFAEPEQLPGADQFDHPSPPQGSTETPLPPDAGPPPRPGDEEPLPGPEERN